MLFTSFLFRHNKLLPVGPNFISARVHMHSCITCLNLKTIDQRQWNPSITSLKFPIKLSSILRAMKSIKNNSLKIWPQKCVYILLKANKSKSQTHHRYVHHISLNDNTTPPLVMVLKGLWSVALSFGKEDLTRLWRWGPNAVKSATYAHVANGEITHISWCHTETNTTSF